MNPAEVTGGCLCGAIRFSIDSTQHHVVANCHCTMCRRQSAAPYVTWLVTAKGAFKFTKGKPKEIRSSDLGRRSFCDRCGSPLTCEIYARPDHIDVTVGTLDNPEAFPPTGQVHTDNRLHWVVDTTPTLDGS